MNKDCNWIKFVLGQSMVIIQGSKLKDCRDFVKLGSEKIRNSPVVTYSQISMKYFDEEKCSPAVMIMNGFLIPVSDNIQGVKKFILKDDKYMDTLEDWTPTEIKLAKELCYNLNNKLLDNGCSVVWYFTNMDSQIFRISAKADMGDVMKYPTKVFNAKANYVTAICTDDVYNKWIGKCVCLCKLTNTPIPAFIHSKNIH